MSLVRSAIMVACLGLLGAGSVRTSAEDALLGARIGAMERSRYATSSREVDRARHELRSLQIRPSERDVGVDRLERALTDLEWDADRLERRLRLERSLATIRANPTRLAPPDAARPPYPADIRGTEGLIGVGKQVVLVQRSLRSSARELALARHAAAARYLARAEGSLARLEGLTSGDPTIRALRLEADRLRHRLRTP